METRLCVSYLHFAFSISQCLLPFVNRQSLSSGKTDRPTPTKSKSMKAPILGDIQLLVIQKSSGNKTGLDTVVIENLKTGLDPLISQDINDVFKVFDAESLKDLTKEELSQYTHVISEDINFPGYDLITSVLMLPVVTSEWLQAVIKNKRAEPLRAYSPNSNHIFKNVTLAANGGLTDDDKDILKTALKTFGGIYLDDLKKSLTHYITNDLDDDNTKLIIAFNEVNPNGQHIHIIKPEWVFNSIKEGKLLDELLYSVGSDKSKRNDVQFPKFLEDINFQFSTTLNLSSAIKKNFEPLMKKTSKNNKTVIYLTRSIDTSLEHSITQKTFDYFFSLLFHKKTNLEVDSLLYYPFHKNHVNGMSQTLIATTNYTGDSRIYIEELITRMGGKFSKTLKSCNTHLVASKRSGRKFEFADGWNVKIVNHMWVEDSFINWNIMDVSKYHDLPRDAGAKNVRIIGDVTFHGFGYSHQVVEPDDEVIAEDSVIVDGSDIEMKDIDEETTKKPLKRKISIKPKKNEIVDSNKEMTNISNEKSADDNYEQEKSEKENGKDDITSDSSKPETITKTTKTSTNSSRVTKSKKVSQNIGTATDEGSKQDKTIKASKTKEDEKRKLQPKKDEDSMWEIPNDSPEKAVPAKRKASPVVELDSDENNNVKRQTKKPTKHDKPYNITAIVTGFDGTLSTGDKRELRKIGVNIVDNPNKNINCIIAPSLLRTQKFLTALSFDPEYFLEPLFLSDVLGTLDSVKRIGDFESISPKVEKYDIWSHVDFDKDIKPKRIFHKNTTKEEAIEYMKKKRKGLFDGFVFYLSPGLAGGFDTLQAILKSFGCKQCVLFKENSKKVNELNKINNIPKVAILVCSVNENKLKKHFASICKENATKFVVLDWDSIVTSIFEAALRITDGNVLEQSGVL